LLSHSFSPLLSLSVCSAAGLCRCCCDAAAGPESFQTTKGWDVFFFNFSFFVFFPILFAAAALTGDALVNSDNVTAF
jgi:hypothetical protein